MTRSTSVPTIGLTGGIASGKTHVARAFLALGVPLLEADDVARWVVEPGEPALAQIAKTFGGHVLAADGRLDRRALREIVFADRAQLKALEAITHPAIRARVQAWRAAQTAPYCIYSAAILIESGMTALVDRVLLVDAPPDVQLSRLMARDGSDEALARQMLAAQARREDRLPVVHDILDNRDASVAVEPAVHRLHRMYIRLAEQPDFWR